MNMNTLPSERAAIGGTIDPDATAAGTVVSDYMSMADFGRAMAIIMAGTFGAGGTMNAKLVQATDSAGTGSKDITGKAMTAFSQADSDKQVIINCLSEELDVDNGFDFVAISMTIGVATSDAGAVLLGFDPRYSPASDNDLASVDEIVN